MELGTTNMTLAFLNNIGPFEMILIGLALLLLFGRRLPEVGKSLGKGIVEFKKGLNSVGDEVNSASAAAQPANQWNRSNEAALPPAAAAMPGYQSLPPGQQAANAYPQPQYGQNGYGNAQPAPYPPYPAQAPTATRSQMAIPSRAAPRIRLLNIQPKARRPMANSRVRPLARWDPLGPLVAMTKCDLLACA